VAAEIVPSDPKQILLSNADGVAITDGRTVLARLVAQVTRPVRWDLCLNTMRELGVTATVELTPAKILTGIAKRELPGIELIAVRTPEDLDAARNLLATAGETAADAPADLVVQSPHQGVFTRASGLEAGSRVVGGSRLGTIRTNRDELAVVAPISATLAEWLRNDGDAVGAGLPIARLSYRNEE
jgi:[acyl-carrier-protein] S-malonyltransferase